MPQETQSQVYDIRKLQVGVPQLRRKSKDQVRRGQEKRQSKPDKDMVKIILAGVALPLVISFLIGYRYGRRDIRRLERTNRGLEQKYRIWKRQAQGLTRYINKRGLTEDDAS